MDGFGPDVSDNTSYFPSWPGWFGSPNEKRKTSVVQPPEPTKDIPVEYLPSDDDDDEKQISQAVNRIRKKQVQFESDFNKPPSIYDDPRDEFRWLDDDGQKTVARETEPLQPKPTKKLSVKRMSDSSEATESTVATKKRPARTLENFGAASTASGVSQSTTQNGRKSVLTTQTEKEQLREQNITNFYNKFNQRIYEQLPELILQDSDLTQPTASPKRRRLSDSSQIEAISPPTCPPIMSENAATVPPSESYRHPISTTYQQAVVDFVTELAQASNMDNIHDMFDFHQFFMNSDSDLTDYHRQTVVLRSFKMLLIPICYAIYLSSEKVMSIPGYWCDYNVYDFITNATIRGLFVRQVMNFAVDQKICSSKKYSTFNSALGRAFNAESMQDQIVLVWRQYPLAGNKELEAPYNYIRLETTSDGEMMSNAKFVALAMHSACDQEMKGEDWKPLVRAAQNSALAWMGVNLGTYFGSHAQIIAYLERQSNKKLLPVIIGSFGRLVMFEYAIQKSLNLTGYFSEKFHLRLLICRNAQQERIFNFVKQIPY